jgi:hypothetical protein
VSVATSERSLEKRYQNARPREFVGWSGSWPVVAPPARGLTEAIAILRTRKNTSNAECPEAPARNTTNQRANGILSPGSVANGREGFPGGPGLRRSSLARISPQPQPRVIFAGANHALTAASSSSSSVLPLCLCVSVSLWFIPCEPYEKTITQDRRATLREVA